MPTHHHLIWKLRISGFIYPYAPSGRGNLPFCLPWFSAVRNNSTVDPHFLIMRGMRTEQLTVTIMGHSVLSYPNTEYTVFVYASFFCLTSIDCWAIPKLKDPSQFSMVFIILPVQS